MLRFAVDLKAKAGASASEVCPKNPKNEVFVVHDPFLAKNFKILFLKNS